MSGRRILITIAFAGLTGSGCPTLDLGEAPPDPGTCRPDPVYYSDVIWPEFIAPADDNLSCVSASGCHAADDGRSSFRVNTDTPVDHDANYTIVTRFLNCGSPDSSSLLTKPLGGVDSHGGGDLFSSGSNSEQVFLQWFNP